MNIRFKPLAIVAAVIFSVAIARTASAQNTALVFDFTKMVLDYTESSGILDVDRKLGAGGSRGLISKEVNNGTVDFADVDFTDDWLFDLELTITGGSGNYSATGAWTVTDTAPGSNAIEASFQSTSITLINGELRIAGVLSVLGLNDSILVNRGDPWKWAGTTGHGDPLGEDLTPDQITFANPGSYDNGALTTIKFLTGINDLDTLFGSDQLLEGGNVKGQIIPAPGALLLGIVGASFVGAVRRRRRA